MSCRQLQRWPASLYNNPPTQGCTNCTLIRAAPGRFQRPRRVSVYMPCFHLPASSSVHASQFSAVCALWCSFLSCSLLPLLIPVLANTCKSSSSGVGLKHLMDDVGARQCRGGAAVGRSALYTMLSMPRRFVFTDVGSARFQSN